MLDLIKKLFHLTEQQKITENQCDFDDTPLTEDQKSKAREKLYRMSYVFTKGDHDLGWTEEVKQEMRLTDETPFKQPYGKVLQGQLEEFRVAFHDLLQEVVIRESNSPFASPVIVVDKKTGEL